MTEPLLKGYAVCLVVPQIGLNSAQLAEVTFRIRQVKHLLPEDARVQVLVPTYDSALPEHGVQDEVRNMARLGAHLMFYGVDPREGGAALAICELAEHSYKSDEVWCCPESTNRKARANQVYRLGQQGRWATRYKLIPPWVEAPAVQKPLAKQMKKERPW